MLYVVCAVPPLIILLSSALQDAQSSGASRVNLESSQGTEACQLINCAAIMHSVVAVGIAARLFFCWDVVLLLCLSFAGPVYFRSGPASGHVSYSFLIAISQ